MDDSSKKEQIRIGARIRAIREEQGMTQGELSEKAHMSLPHISAIELGKVEMKLTTIMKLLEALQVSADSILRPDTPQGKIKYQEEFASILTECNPSETESLLKILREIVTVWRTQKRDQDY